MISKQVLTTKTGKVGMFSDPEIFSHMKQKRLETYPRLGSTNM